MLCTNNVYKVTKLVDKISICNFFRGQDENMNIQLESMVNEEGVSLCKEHFGAWYRHIHPSQSKCKTCNKNITDMSKSRACPQPDIIQKCLRENADFSGEIANDDRVCYACYKSHLIIIKLLNNTVHSTDVDLRLLITKIQLDTPIVSDVPY